MHKYGQTILDIDSGSLEGCVLPGVLGKRKQVVGYLSWGSYLLVSHLKIWEEFIRIYLAGSA